MSKTMIGGVSKKDLQAVIVDLLKEHLTVNLFCDSMGRLEIEVRLFEEILTRDATYLRIDHE